MKNKLAFAVAFVAGGFVFNAPSVLSTVSNPQDVLADAVAKALVSVDRYSEERENETLDQLPNILDCQNMEWMKSCTALNRNAKKHPNAPIRLTNAQGLEFNFQPGTPSAVIRLQLEQSEAAAEAYLAYMDQTWGEYHKSAELFKMAKWKAGELQNMKGLDAAIEKNNAVKNIDTKSVSLSVFVESTCPVCERQLETLSNLQQRYPNLGIRVFQLDQDKEAFVRNVNNRGLTGRIVSPEERQKLERLGIVNWPRIWVDNTRASRRQTLIGNKTLLQLEDRLQAMTYVQTAKAGD
ncbi:hypothetical protein EGJ28_16635 [Stutzerimonas xanthomarina]|jgi:thiol-disulfide isomerase/thioredoxin|uniref:Thioredoxin domain-containing protein n=1 Tax=Stutzerimonas xanthomarina TaxID=271420 RepID=A0A3R8V5E6_9GAMM|nr:MULTISPECIES: conjugal transfer protein TraF [Stutzerimonas]KIL03208.1 hypothetical protein QX25_18730 [Stutzerimonas stutzeri]RRV08889.1 hypothetical protein EGJ28_16635 [Stutzerimonas xanthomarina]